MSEAGVGAEAEPRHPPSLAGTLRIEGSEPRRRPRRILALKLDHFGDYIIGLPALEQLRAAFPQDDLTLICGPWNVGFAQASGLFDAVRPYTFFPQNALGWDGKPVEPVEAFRAAAAGHYDLAIDLRVDPDTRFLLAEVDAALRCGIGTRARSPFLDIVLPAERRANPLFGQAAGRLMPPDRFRSYMPIQRPFHHSTDFSVSDRYMIDGPDLTLSQGRYRLTYKLSPQGVPGLFGASVMIEVTCEDKLIVRRVLKRRRGLTLAPGQVEFEVPAEGGVYEFRLHTGGHAPGGRLRFSGVWVERLDNPVAGEPVPGRARLRPTELHVGETLSLLVSLVRQRVETLYHPRTISQSGDAPTLPAGRPRIVMAPLSNSTLRDWPLDRYAELAGRLGRELGATVLLVGAQGQATTLAQLASLEDSGPRVVNLAGRTAWGEMPALLRQADLVICNNSGIAHLAAACGVATLAIFSASHPPSEWGPRGPRVRTMMAAVPCSPCGHDKLEACPYGHRCMHAIGVDSVMEQARAMLAEAPVPA